MPAAFVYHNFTFKLKKMKTSMNKIKNTHTNTHRENQPNQKKKIIEKYLY